MHRELKHALVDSVPALALRARDRRVAAQTLDRSVAVQQRIRDVHAGVAKMRRVSGVEGVEAKLNLRLLFHREFTEDRGVLIKGARPAYRIKAGGPECHVRYRRKRQGIEP